MKVLAACLLMLAAGCSTTTWTETTQVKRPVGPTTRATLDVPLAQRDMHMTTGREADGFLIDRRVFTDDNGVARLSLLPVALQCLAYKHDVRLTVRYTDEEREVHAEVVTAERAHAIIEEWRVQCRLGTSAPLRASEFKLLDKLVDTYSVAATVEALVEIRAKVDVRPDWE